MTLRQAQGHGELYRTMKKNFPPKADQPRAEKIVFFGTPEFGKIILERLIESNYKPILVVTAPDKPVGRKQIMTPPPTKVLAEKYGVDTIQPEQIRNSTQSFDGSPHRMIGATQSFDGSPHRMIGAKSEIRNLRPDLIIVAAYGKVIPKEILGIPKYGALNVHPSLLPRWRGPSPIQYAILNDDRETGATIMLMDEELDHGPVLTNFQFSIFNFQLTADELSKKLAKIGAELLIETIPKWIAGEIKPREQEHGKATYSKIITKEDGRIDWSKSAEEIERQIRAFTPWPGSFTFWNDMRIKIIEGSVEARLQQDPMGKILDTPSKKFAVQTGKGIFIIEKLQIEGKNEMAAKQFLNGYPSIIGAVLK